MNPKISEIQILPIKPQNGLVAFASFVLNNSLYLSSIAIMTRPQGGYRLLYPTKKVGARSLNIYHPINREFAELIEKEVIRKFEEVMNKYDRYDSVNLRT
ncbi:MAG: septation protein SpoVG family protein [Candidatus Omnitrophica bacterium]|nr:septation protein SpoVG family protein [Candidatus Omnitrophota bacterium]